MNSIIRILYLGFVAMLLGGCATPMATVPNSNGAPVMLLGFDPVGYFTQGKPVRGLAELAVALPDRTYYFASKANRDAFVASPEKFEPQYGGFCASGAAFAVKLGSDPGAWQIEGGRLFIFGDVLGQTAWQLDPAWNIAHADRIWPSIADKGWRAQSLWAYANKVAHYQSGLAIKTEWERRNPGKTWPSFDPGGMLNNLFFEPPGWRAATGFGQPALGYPD